MVFNSSSRVYRQHPFFRLVSIPPFCKGGLGGIFWDWRGALACVPGDEKIPPGPLLRQAQDATLRKGGVGWVALFGIVVATSAKRISPDSPLSLFGIGRQLACPAPHGLGDDRRISSICCHVS
jgi:hypothetical protein